LMGGARSVVGSHLRVDDRAAQQVVETLTPLLLQNQSPSAALRQSMRRLYDQAPFRNPAYWAQFELVGEGAHTARFGEPR
jgi:CHAT domain-containing protein